MTKGGETSKSEKVEKGRENIETVRIRSVYLSPVLQIPEIHQFTAADVKETAKMQSI